MHCSLDMGAYYHALHMQLAISAWEGTQSCGEDAYFISKKKNMMGVSDGVSAWSAYGLGNSGYLAFYLMSNARMAAEQKDISDTEKILHEAFEAVWDLHDNKLVSIPNGSATATFLKLLENPTTQQPFLQYSNLGDCMIVIIRPENLDQNSTNLRIIHQSKKLYSYHEHARGIPVPLQLVFYPAQGRKLSTEQSGGVDTQTVDVQEGDIIILATDGLWDNLMTDDALKIVSSCMNPQRKDAQGEALPICPKDLAKKLVEEAFRINIKPDDITAVVGIVKG